MNYPQGGSSALGEMLQFVTFSILQSGGRSLTMALNVQKVKEIVEIDQLSHLPNGFEAILGIYDLRGCPVPVIDISAMISSRNLPKPERHQQTRLVICDLQNIWVGIPVEKTGRIFSCPSSHFLPPPVGTKTETRKLITGMVRKDSDYIPILDLDNLLDSIGIKEEPPEAVEALPNYAGKRVLIVEDSKIILKKLQELFTRLGCTTELAENGIEGLKKIAELPPFDLVFTDIEMPMLDGIAMARTIRQHAAYTKTPILFNSALSNPSLITDIEKEGLGHYLVKFDSKLILKHLHSAFAPAA